MAYTVHINPDDPKSIDAALRTEWLLTNGLGGYAMGTALGVNTRRYHGLLVAATKPPVGRIVALHSVIEQLIIPRGDGTAEVVDLSTQQFVGGDGEPMLHPNGWRWLRRFTRQVDSVEWEFQHPLVSFRRGVCMAANRHRLDIKYVIETSAKNWRLVALPMVAARDFHGLNRSDPDSSLSPAEIRDAMSIAMRFDIEEARRTYTEPLWQNFAYQADRDRGQQWIEDIWPYARMEVDGAGSTEVKAVVSASLLGELPARSGPLPRPSTAIGPPSSEPGGAQSLESAASQFVVQRWFGGEIATSVIAGYPWFGDWGRDTMIALPGLMLCTGRLAEARSTLECFAKHLRNGLIPNLFDDYGGAAHYNTVDASLWFVHAVHAISFPFPSGRGEAVANLVAPCRNIIAAYRRGTDFGIRMDHDGLIVAGDPTTQLTWMDAARDGVVFTPRCGKAVEINALWHNALLCLSEMSDDSNERNELIMLARRVAASFRSAFWWDERQCLHDCLSPSGLGLAPDGRLRPNQIFAVRLPYSPLNEPQQRAVVKVVGERLLTPFGLRTLDRDDPSYKPRYEGNLFERDAAYHNGTVWPWLIGPYCEALLRVEKFSADSKKRVREILQPLIDEMSNASGGRCLGQIAEVYDGEAPHRPSGCPAQAWSVAEVLRLSAMVS